MVVPILSFCPSSYILPRWYFFWYLSSVRHIETDCLLSQVSLKSSCCFVLPSPWRHIVKKTHQISFVIMSSQGAGTDSKRKRRKENWTWKMSLGEKELSLNIRFYFLQSKLRLYSNFKCYITHYFVISKVFINLSYFSIML